MNLSHNVSRVKRKLEITDKIKAAPERNYSQLHSHTGDGKTSDNSNEVNGKINFKSQSKPTMGEKTTEEDSTGQKDSGPPSPVDEVGKEPVKSSVVSSGSRHSSANNGQKANFIARRMIRTNLNSGSEMATPSNGPRLPPSFGHSSKLE